MTVDSGRAAPFESISELKEAHSHLLGALDSELQADTSPEAETTAIVRHEADAHSFIERCAATGVFLENLGDRTAATVLMDYWTSTLVRAGRPTTSLRLAPFDAEQLPSLDTTSCPFKGLDAFRLEDRKFFFGREADTEALVAQFNQSPLLIVSGPSGSGKSSLVMSGLLPAVATGNAFVLLPVIRPANAVLDHVAAAAQLGHSQPEPGLRLREDPARLSTWLGGDQARPTVMTFDQFEEVFTLCTEEDRNALVANLATLLAAGRGHHVVLDIRQEFKSRVVELTALLPYLDKAWFEMRPMSYDQLRAAIDEPARAANLQFQPGIADDLAKKVLGQSAALPLLQYTLHALWESRDRNRITQEVYRRVGDPLTALKYSADRFYDSVPPETQAEVKRVLVELVRVDDFLEAYRQPVPLHHLLAAGKANTRDVIELLRQNDYLAVTSDEGDNAIVEVKHESLIRNWPRYVQWIDEKRLIRRRRLTLTEAAERWTTSGKNPELLFRGLQLDDAKTYEDLSDREKEFLHASVEASDQLKRDQENRIRREGKRRVRLLSATTLVFLAVATALAYLWRQAELKGERAALLAELAGARFLAESDPTAGVAAIGAALEHHQSTIAGDADLSSVALRTLFSVPDSPLTQAKFNHERVVAGLILHDEAGIVTRGQTDLRFWSVDGTLRGAFPKDVTSLKEIRLAVLDASGKNVVAVWADGSARLFDAQGATIREWAPAGEAVSAAAYSAQADRLFEALSGAGLIKVLGSDGAEVRRLGQGVGLLDKLAASSDGTLVITLQSGSLLLWDVASGGSRSFPVGREGTPTRSSARRYVDVSWPIRNAWFSPVGHSILAIGSDRTLRVWNPDTATVAPTRIATTAVRSAAFSSDGQRIATLSSSNVVELWGADGGKISDWGTSPSDTVLFNTSHSQIATTSSQDGTVNVWDLDGTRNALLRGHAGIGVSAVFDTSDKFVLTAAPDGTARLWNWEARLTANLKGGAGEVTSMAFSQDSKRLVTTSGQSARVWNSSFSSETELAAHTAAVVDAQFSPDGQHVVTASWDTTARVWKLADGSSRELKGHTDWVLLASFSPDGRHVLTASADRTARMWTLDGELEATWEARGALGFTSLGFSPDGRRILTADGETVQLWDVSNRSVRSILTFDDAQGDATLSRDGSHVLTSDSTGVRVWDTSGKAIRLLSLEAASGVPAGFSMNGDRVFTAAPDGTVALWSLTGTKLEAFNAGKALRTVRLHRNAQLIVTVATDNVIQLWNWSGRLLATLAGESVVMSPDGEFMVALLPGGNTPRAWPISISAYLRRLDTLQLPCLTATQLREGLLLDEAEAQRQERRCVPTAQTGIKP